MKEYNVKIYTSTKVTKIGDHVLEMDYNGQSHQLENIEYVVVAVGICPNQNVLLELDDYNGEIITIGNASSSKNGFEDIREAFEHVLEI